MMKWKVGGLFMVVGGSLLKALEWHAAEADPIFFWAWLILAALSSVVATMVNEPMVNFGRFKVKVAVPSVLLGATVLITGNWLASKEFSQAGIWGTITFLLAVIVYMIKPPTVAKA
ncbi:MAG: hypothetical protein AAB879_03575 [Patescibacteria group bacterium]